MINSPTRLRLLGLAFNNTVESPHAISLSTRISYVNKVETTHDILIPDPYRTILTEWPHRNPQLGCTGRILCGSLPPDSASVLDKTTRTQKCASLFNLVMVENKVPLGRWELFNHPIRLYTRDQNAKTMRFIRAHPADGFQWTQNGSWASFNFKVLILSRYRLTSRQGTSDGVFVMMLDGPTRGQIHGWDSGGDSWYDGFEAENLWDWNYLEWDRDATDAVYSDDDEDATSDS
ncbi:hypothetical protein B0H17DRAFT_1208864 [Mycena rosella]|uniref:Uncharacterized protein n=1 Tax=Mycena rosella TaxID=1033263 RepID=A0AAD7D064_MYCRO|nr:hypothetical protein B0H17DRAFT_1208864 [Mycena rosella]